MSVEPQAPLDLVLPRRRAMGRADFVETDSNAVAAAMVGDWRAWPGGRLALCGPEGSGKTHLAHVFMAESGAALARAAELAADDAPRLTARGAVVVEDVDRASEAVEPALFHLFNLAAADGAVLLLTGRDAPSRWGLRLPDLVSRVVAMPLVRLGPPDDALLAAVIAKALEDRGLRYEPGVPAYLAARIERTFAAAEAAVARLDAASLARARPVTRRLAAEVID
ncbi:MAG: chromosomal replication initiator DnaA [Rubrimonas sp.]